MQPRNLRRKNCRNFTKLGGSILQGFRFQVRKPVVGYILDMPLVGCVSLISLTFVEKHRPLNDLAWSTLVVAVWIPLLIVVWTPAIAIGALFNHAWRGALVGFVFVVVLIVLTIAVII